MLQVRRVDAFEDNYIWLAGTKDSPRVAVVDPGDADPVFAALEANSLEPEAILITHHHPDHTGGIPELVDRYRIPVYGPAHERIGGITHPMEEGREIVLSTGLTFRVLDTPGHTRGHICYVGEGALFCGDTLFAAGCGRLFEGTAEQMHASLEKLAALPDDTLVYCAHEYTLANLAFARVAEPDNRDILERQNEARQIRERGDATVPSTMRLEKRTNPFLRSTNPELRAAAERFAGRSLEKPSEVFATVRHWKDTLD
jgi:hydroxyacylglutathione hydrolase